MKFRLSEIFVVQLLKLKDNYKNLFLLYNFSYLYYNLSTVLLLLCFHLKLYDDQQWVNIT